MSFLVDTRCKLNVHKTLRTRPERLLNVLCTFNLRLLSVEFWKFILLLDIILSEPHDI